jgi:hypothetical protein
MTSRAVFAAIAWFAVACAAAPPAPTLKARDYPMALTPPSQHPGDFLRRQTLVARYQSHTSSFEAVLQKKGDVLTLIGLTPFGTKAFVLTQTGVEVKFTSFIPRELPFPPQYILNDIDRTYFQGILEGVLPDGTHTADRNGEQIRERWEKGRLQERRFTRLAHDPPGEIVITYAGGMDGGRSPALIEFENGWFGYHLAITTVSEEAL